MLDCRSVAAVALSWSPIWDDGVRESHGVWHPALLWPDSSVRAVRVEMMVGLECEDGQQFRGLNQQLRMPVV